MVDTGLIVRSEFIPDLSSHAAKTVVKQTVEQTVIETTKEVGKGLVGSVTTGVVACESLEIGVKLGSVVVEYTKQTFKYLQIYYI